MKKVLAAFMVAGTLISVSACEGKAQAITPPPSYGHSMTAPTPFACKKVWLHSKDGLAHYRCLHNHK